MRIVCLLVINVRGSWCVYANYTTHRLYVPQIIIFVYTLYTHIFNIVHIMATYFFFVAILKYAYGVTNIQPHKS